MTETTAQPLFPPDFGDRVAKYQVEARAILESGEIDPGADPIIAAIEILMHRHGMEAAR